MRRASSRNKPGGCRRCPPGHADPLLIGLSGLAAVLAVLLSCGFWILAGWPGGATAAIVDGFVPLLLGALYPTCWPM